MFFFAKPCSAPRAEPTATSRVIKCRKPTQTPRVPALVCCPRCASGISSSTTTYIMAPAEKASSHGIHGVSAVAPSTTSTPNTGSASPESAPMAKAFGALMPSWSIGSDTAAPSGTFWMPMPMARATAMPTMAGSPPFSPAMANSSPTDIPSGMLCSVTAVNSRVGRCQRLGRPSGSFSPGCKCGSKACSPMRNATPSAKPPAAASQGTWPASSARSMAGISSDHTDAAIMTPAANPRNTRWAKALSRPRNRNTAAAPRVVMRKVKPVPRAAHVNACSMMASRLFAPYRHHGMIGAKGSGPARLAHPSRPCEVGGTGRQAERRQGRHRAAAQARAGGAPRPPSPFRRRRRASAARQRGGYFSCSQGLKGPWLSTVRCLVARESVV